MFNYWSCHVLFLKKKMEWDRVVPKTRAEARKAEENGFLGDGDE